jgi:predicted ATPase
MQDPAAPFLTSLTLEGFLSFGPGPYTVPLTPLNVVIGPNGSGKSNFVEALSVLRAVPRDLPLPIRQGGGVKDWLWRGEMSRAEWAQIAIEVGKEWVAQRSPASYRLRFGARGSAFTVLDERLESAAVSPKHPKPYLYFGYENGRPMINVKQAQRALELADIDLTQSILSQRRDPDTYPELTRLSDHLGRIPIYRSWQFGPEATARNACRADVRTDTLSESFDNLPARLAVLKAKPQVKRRLLLLLHELAPGFDDLEVVPEGGLLQLYLIEGSRSFSPYRLSDGTLRFLCLLAILLDPSHAPLIVIEEPELGLHPDLLPTLRDLLVEASATTQLIVTTHSTQLVDAMMDHAGSVLVCEKEGASTRLTRLDPEEVARWREHGSLGSLWMSGHLGGTRW